MLEFFRYKGKVHISSREVHPSGKRTEAVDPALRKSPTQGRRDSIDETFSDALLKVLGTHKLVEITDLFVQPARKSG
jgi:hypothetical protein